MSTFRPKDILREAREAEEHGQKRDASSKYASLAIYLRRRGQFKEAKKLVERAIQLSPEAPRLYLQRALCEVGLGQEKAAQTAVRLFTRRAVRRNKVEEYRPYIEQQLKDLPSLREVFYTALLDIERTNAEPFLGLARALIEQQKLDGARKTLLDALKTKTMEKEVLELLTSVLEASNRNEDLVHLRRYTSGDMAMDDLLLLLRGEVRPSAEKSEQETERESQFEDEKDLQLLIRELEEKMGLDVDQGLDSVDPLVREFRRKSDVILAGDSKTRIDMALAFFEMGLVEDARDELRPIAVTDPQYLQAQCLLGEILHSEGSDLGALEVFQNILRDQRATHEIWCEAKFKLVQIYLRLGDLRQALAQALELEKKTPGYRDVHRLKLQIQEASQSQESGVDSGTPGRTSPGRGKRKHG